MEEKTEIDRDEAKKFFEKEIGVYPHAYLNTEIIIRQHLGNHLFEKINEAGFVPRIFSPSSTELYLKLDEENCERRFLKS